MTITIRIMKSEDLAAVAELAAQLGYPGSLQQFQNRFSKLEKLESSRLLIAVSPKGIVGWIHVDIEPPRLVDDARAEVVALVVDESERGHGIGRELLHAAEAWAVLKGLSVVRLRSNVKRTAAHRFYLREGYENTKTSQVFVKRLT